MPKVRQSERFFKDYLTLDTTLQDDTDSAIKTFVENPRYPSLHFKKMQGHKNRYEMRVNDAYRITLEKAAGEKGVYILRRVGPHDILKNP